VSLIFYGNEYQAKKSEGFAYDNSKTPVPVISNQGGDKSITALIQTLTFATAGWIWHSDQGKQ